MQFTANGFKQRLIERLRQEDSETVPPARNQTVDLSGLIKIRDEGWFLHEAYRRILGRECDPTGFAYFEELLRRKVPRPVVLHRLATSQEAKDTGNRYVGIRPPGSPAVLWYRIAESVRAAMGAMVARFSGRRGRC